MLFDDAGKGHTLPDKQATAEVIVTHLGRATVRVASYRPKLLPGARPVGNVNIACMHAWEDEEHATPR